MVNKRGSHGQKNNKHIEMVIALTNGFVLQFNAVSPVIWSVGGDGGGGYRIIG